MKNAMKALVVLVLIAQATSAQIVFQKTFRSEQYDYGEDAKQTRDGGYIITGRFDQYILLLKTDAYGVVVWKKTYWFSTPNVSYHVEQTFDDGYVITGMASGDFFLLKTNSTGDSIWTKTFGGSGSDGARSVKQTPDGGFILAGSTNSLGTGRSDIYLLKTDSIGQLLWTKVIGHASNAGGMAIQIVNTSRFIISGCYPSSNGDLDFCLIKTDSVGMPVWSKLYGGPINDIAYDVEQTSDSGFIMAGETSSFGPGLINIYIVKTDRFGNLEWSRTYGQPNSYSHGYAVQQTNDGGFVIAGKIAGAINNYEIYLIKINNRGNVEWVKTIGNSTPYTSNSISRTSDNGFIIGGNMGQRICYIKTDSTGHSGCDESTSFAMTLSPTTTTTDTTLPVIALGTETFHYPFISVRNSIFSSLCNVTGLEESTKDKSLLIFQDRFDNGVFMKGTEEKKRVLIFNSLGQEIASQETNNTITKINTTSLAIGVLYVQLISATFSEKT